MTVYYMKQEKKEVNDNNLISFVWGFFLGGVGGS